MPISYRYNFKPKGSGNTQWVTVSQTRSSRRNASVRKSGFGGNYVAGVLARVVVSLFRGK